MFVTEDVVLETEEGSQVTQEVSTMRIFLRLQVRCGKEVMVRSLEEVEVEDMQEEVAAERHLALEAGAAAGRHIFICQCAEIILLFTATEKCLEALDEPGVRIRVDQQFALHPHQRSTGQPAQGLAAGFHAAAER